MSVRSILSKSLQARGFGVRSKPLRQSLCRVLISAENNTAFSSATARMSSSSSNASSVDISGNPFFEKYKAKIQHMQSTNPEEYEEKLKELAERLAPKPVEPQVSENTTKGKSEAEAPKVVPPSEAARAGVGMTRSKGLDSVMKLETIQDKSADEITQIWNQYHSTKDCVFAVLKADEFENLIEKSKECPVFVFPIPRDDGFEFILCQFDRHDVYFTPLAMFQMVRENAPPCLTLSHYPELMESKGIVLMEGHFDDKVLKQELALSLVQQMSIFYGKNSKFFDLVRRFNYQPESFQYQELIDALKSLPQYDMK
ncbi:ATP synthase mitochondrial F1 complex assembly factor 1 [Aplysia californica]|uniref:ATP synthase mitochondrial F1 complex assembly factor 1 n=1 Tax=Aplysia californica TaxID=6500 RepID=A0ABM0JPC5_APLCA|nr:ATP synthase mitochondrial F1 complex assembly factor 1 [Aplysia californica]